MKSSRRFGSEDSAVRAQLLARPIRTLQTAVLVVAMAACDNSARDVGSVDGHVMSNADSGTVAAPKCNDMPTQLLEAADLFVPERRDDGISAGMDLAVNATDVYVAVSYSADGALLRVPIRGGQAQLIATIDGSEQGLLVTDDSVVFAQSRQGANDDVSGEIVRVGLDGGETTVLATGRIARATIFGPSGVVASDGRNVYFATQDGSRSVPLAGGSVQTLTPHTGSVAIVGSKLVIADGMAGSVFSMPLEGGDTTTLASNLGEYLGPVVRCGKDICWASAVPGPAASGTEAITRLDPHGTATTVLEGDGLFVYRLVFDAGDFFVSTEGDASFGSVFKISAGGDRAAVAEGTGLATDDECVYTGSVIGGVSSVRKTYREDAQP